MNPFPQLNADMLVRSADGESLGSVVSVEGSGVRIEKGIFFQHERVVPFDEIDSVRDGVVYLKSPAGELTGMETLLDDDIVKGGFNNQIGVAPPVSEVTDLPEPGVDAKKTA